MIGIYGGTFDPVHFGHLRAAWEVREQLRIPDFRLLPAGQPPHREQAVTPAHHRLNMLRLATRGLPGMLIDEREIERDGPSYMVDTLAEIRAETPDRPVLMIVGQDSAETLDRWHRWRDILTLAHIVIMCRPGPASSAPDGVPAAIEGARAKSSRELADSASGRVWTVDVTQLDISSSSIRELVATGRSPRFLLPDSVLEYIGTQGLYR